MKTKQKFRVMMLILLLPIIAIAQQNTSNKMHVITFNKYKNYTEVNTGFWNASVDNNTICIELTDQNKKKKQTYLIVNCFDTNEFENLSDSTSSFKLTRLAGVLNFRGDFSKEDGQGTFKFTRNSNFEKFLKNENFDITDELYYFKLFLGDISKDYITGVKALGYNPSIRELGRLVYHDASLEYIEAVTTLFNGQISIDMISSFSIHNVSESYIKSLKSLKMLKVEPHGVKQLAIHDISIEYIKALQNFGFEDLSISEIKKAKIHDVSIDFIEASKNKGQEFTRLYDYIKLKIHNKNK
nr:hypothetical protein [uncultured Psychroserpens sp.]